MDDQYTFENKTYRDTYRHTTSHILAQAMKRLYPEVKLGQYKGLSAVYPQAELSEEEKYEAAQYIVEEANRLAVMSERLLQMAALRGEQAAREPVDVPALLEKAARTVAPKAAARGVAPEPVQADACPVQDWTGLSGNPCPQMMSCSRTPISSSLPTSEAAPPTWATSSCPC